MTTQLYRDLFELCVGGAVARSKDSADSILDKPGEVMRELILVLPPLEADKLIDAIEAVNRDNDTNRAHRETEARRILAETEADDLRRLDAVEGRR